LDDDEVGEPVCSIHSQHYAFLEKIDQLIRPIDHTARTNARPYL
jgi:hypothetical protein